MDIHELAKKSYDRALSQKNLEEKQMGRLMLAHSNGIWICNTELICLLYSYKHLKEVVLLDSNKIPRKINTNTLLNLVQQRHQEVMNDWLNEYSSLTKIRTARHVLE